LVSNIVADGVDRKDRRRSIYEASILCIFVPVSKWVPPLFVTIKVGTKDLILTHAKVLFHDRRKHNEAGITQSYILPQKLRKKILKIELSSA
jgi:hypothetical protein